MYRIIKVLNNNGILVLDGDTGRELILLGNGIGFGHRTGERLEQVKEAKRYELVTGKSTALQQVNSIDPVFIEAAGNIIESARKTLGDISSDILIPMADHIALAAGRAREGRELPNPFNQDIKALFDREYQAAMEGREIIREMTDISISEDEVGYITLHIHAGECGPFHGYGQAGTGQYPRHRRENGHKAGSGLPGVQPSGEPSAVYDCPHPKG